MPLRASSASSPCSTAAPHSSARSHECRTHLLRRHPREQSYEAEHHPRRVPPSRDAQRHHCTRPTRDRDRPRQRASPGSHSCQLNQKCSQATPRNAREVPREPQRTFPELVAAEQPRKVRSPEQPSEQVPLAEIRVRSRQECEKHRRDHQGGAHFASRVTLRLRSTLHLSVGRTLAISCERRGASWRPMAERQQVTPNRSARSAKALVSFIALLGGPIHACCFRIAATCMR